MNNDNKFMTYKDAATALSKTVESVRIKLFGTIGKSRKQ